MIYVTKALNKYFLDIRVAFLQAKILDREVYMKLPEDQRVDGYVWKLKKPLYGLD